MSKKKPAKNSCLLPALGCALAVMVAIALVHPAGEIPMGDEITYAKSAHMLAQTGRINYVGGINAMAGWQLYWGAAAIRLFGFSFLVLRWSMAALAMATAFLLPIVFIRAGVRSTLAVAGTLTFCLSPLFLSNAAVFLTDVPGAFAVIVCLYACLRALELQSVRGTIAWIAVATIGSSVLGSARQYAWLSGLVMVPSVVWLLRKNRSVVRAGAGLWFVGLAMDCAMQYWFVHQPYTNREATLLLGMTPRRIYLLCLEGLGVLLEVGLLLLPVLLALLPMLLRKRFPRAFYVVCLLFVLGVIGLWRIHSLQALEIPYVGTSFNWPLAQRTKIVVTVLDVLGLLALLLAVLTRSDHVAKSGDGHVPVAERSLLVLLLPFLLAYMIALLPRAYSPGLWDRYLLPPIAILLVWILRLYQGRIDRAEIVLLLALCLGAYSVALIHDQFAGERAQLQALHQLAARGVPRTAVTGGWPYDFETELEIRPYLTAEGVRLPKGVALPVSTHYGIDNCQGFQCVMVSDVVPKYAVTNEAGRALPGFYAVPYRGWVTPSGVFYVTPFP